jgi:hypothetical protein
MTAINTTLRSHFGGTSDETREYHPWGFSDKKARALGSRIWTGTVVYVPVDEANANNVWHIAPGTYFAWRGTATRAAEAFGAGQRTHYCKSEAERARAIAKYLVDAKKRAQKWAQVGV